MELDALAHALATDGIAAHETDVASFIHTLRTGVCPTLLVLLADRTAPAVARERAFGLLAAQADRPGASATAGFDRACRSTISAAA